MRPSFLCILRHVNERTREKSLSVAKKLFDKVIEVSTTPFFEAVKETFYIGALNPAYPLLLALDADVLLNKNSVAQLSSIWNQKIQEDPKLFRLDCLVKDKFRGHVFAGCHVYNNLYSNQVFSFLDNEILYDPLQKRPESANLVLFRKQQGLNSCDYKKLIFGLHDFDQYYKHIYAKYYNRAVRDQKVFQKIYNMIQSKQQENPEDHDFVIALRAMRDAQNPSATMNTDAQQYTDITPILTELGIKEKEPLDV